MSHAAGRSLPKPLQPVKVYLTYTHTCEWVSVVGDAQLRCLQCSSKHLAHILPQPNTDLIRLPFTHLQRG